MHWALQENTINKLVRYSGNVPNGNRLKLVAMGWFLIRVQLLEIVLYSIVMHLLPVVT